MSAFVPLGSSGRMEPWKGGYEGGRGGEEGCAVCCVQTSITAARRGEETPGVKVRRNLMISSFCPAGVDFQTHHL